MDSCTIIRHAPKLLRQLHHTARSGSIPVEIAGNRKCRNVPNLSYWSQNPKRQVHSDLRFVSAANDTLDYAELVQPPVFSYGFYLPQTILIFIICIVYSVLHNSWQVLLPGLAYFLIGGFVYKYQLLYAMDHRQHSTGKSWIMICDRILVGLVVFQLTMGGQLALKHAPIRGALTLPLIVGTVWFAYVYNRTYRPLMRFIALKSVRRAEHTDYGHFGDPEEIPEDLARWRYESETQHGVTVDESRETGIRFINPSLISP